MEGDQGVSRQRRAIFAAGQRGRAHHWSGRLQWLVGENNVERLSQALQQASIVAVLQAARGQAKDLLRR
jgi:hypothetical protein